MRCFHRGERLILDGSAAAKLQDRYAQGSAGHANDKASLNYELTSSRSAQCFILFEASSHHAAAA